MPPRVALILTILFIVWLLARYGRGIEGVSGATWVPCLWVLIIGSRPVSWWFFGAQPENGTDVNIEGSPLDRNLYLFLILCSIFVISKRGISLGQFARNNRPLAVFCLWLGMSVLWSDFPGIAFKRFFKDIGNIFMVLVLLSEKNPSSAVKALFIRFAYVLIPLSVVYIRYFPDIGRYYDRFTGKGAYGGVTTNKNLLGITLAICSVALVQQIFDLRQIHPSLRDRKLCVGVALICIMTIWLFHMADSSTSIACSLLGIGVLCSSKIPYLKARLRKLWVYTFVLAALLIGSHLAFNTGALLVGLLGRDLTFTGRTDIWQIVLREKLNPLLGSGFYSFWLGDRIDKLSTGYSFRLNEAHNGYLETYLNSGLVGVVLLLILIAASGARLSKLADRSESIGAFRLAIFFMTLIYNITESLFNRLTPIWFAFLFAVIFLPRNHLGRCESRATPVLESNS
jgi:exopolysaccharide production protein ExoQ